MIPGMAEVVPHQQMNPTVYPGPVSKVSTQLLLYIKDLFCAFLRWICSLVFQNSTVDRLPITPIMVFLATGKHPQADQVLYQLAPFNRSPLSYPRGKISIRDPRDEYSVELPQNSMSLLNCPRDFFQIQILNVLQLFAFRFPPGTVVINWFRGNDFDVFHGIS
jgi:hypothetical protein